MADVRVSTARIVSMYASGIGAPQIAKQLGCSRDVVYKRLKVAGVKSRSLSEVQQLRSPISKVTKETVSDLYAEGHSQDAVAAMLGVSKGAMRRFMKRNGIPRRRASYSPYAESRYELVVDERALVYDYVHNEATQETVARKHGLSVRLAVRVLRRHGVPIRKRRPSTVDLERAEALREQGKTLQQIGDELGVSRAAVFRRLAKARVARLANTHDVSESVCSNSAASAA